MKKLSIIMAMVCVVMAILEHNLAVAAVFSIIMIYEIIDEKERTKEKILNRTKLMRVEPGDKIVFRFNPDKLTHSDIEKCKKLLNEIFKGHEIIGVAETMDLSIEREERT